MSETALMLSYSQEPPNEFILSLEDTIRSHVNLVEERVWTHLEPVFDDLSKL